MYFILYNQFRNLQQSGEAVGRCRVPSILEACVFLDLIVVVKLKSECESGQGVKIDEIDTFQTFARRLRQWLRSARLYVIIY